jgi:hypothetical protein
MTCIEAIRHWKGLPPEREMQTCQKLHFSSNQ